MWLIFFYVVKNDMFLFYASHRYFRHAYGEMYVITNALARFVSINRSVSTLNYTHNL